MTQTLTAIAGKKVKTVDARKRIAVLTDGTMLKVELVTEPVVQKGAVAKIRRLYEKGKTRAQIIAAGYNPNTVSTQLYKLSHS